jgi:hypothetical protein
MLSIGLSGNAEAAFSYGYHETNMLLLIVIPSQIMPWIQFPRIASLPVEEDILCKGGMV